MTLYADDSVSQPLLWRPQIIFESSTSAYSKKHCLHMWSLLNLQDLVVQSVPPFTNGKSSLHWVEFMFFVSISLHWNYSVKTNSVLIDVYNDKDVATQFLSMLTVDVNRNVDLDQLKSASCIFLLVYVNGWRRSTVNRRQPFSSRPMLSTKVNLSYF